MTLLIIGSAAAKHWFPDWRDPKDVDCWASPSTEDYIRERADARYDFFWDDRLCKLLDVFEDRFATPDELYTIKFSHAYWELKNGSWGKHMADMLKLRERGAQFLPEWHDVLYPIWEDHHGRKVVDLTKEADDFFADAVKRIYDHDSIHLSVAYTPGKPIYDECLKDGKTVQIDMSKVWDMPHERIVQMFREEIYVTALERLVIPRNYKYSAGAAYQWALRRTITSLTKGASARFIVSNFDDFKRPDMDYVKHHLQNVDKLIPL